ncbi:hypothetical protein ACFL1R_12420 [Candidatus Latescibacterota bacterium]
MPAKKDSEAIIRDIKRKTRKKYNAEEKVRIVLDGSSYPQMLYTGNQW